METIENYIWGLKQTNYSVNRQKCNTFLSNQAATGKLLNAVDTLTDYHQNLLYHMESSLVIQGKNTINRWLFLIVYEQNYFTFITTVKWRNTWEYNKTVSEFRRKNFFPGFIGFLLVNFNICLTCAQVKSPKQTYFIPPLNTVSSNTSLIADMLQIGKITRSGGFS